MKDNLGDESWVKKINFNTDENITPSVSRFIPMPMREVSDPFTLIKKMSEEP